MTHVDSISRLRTEAFWYADGHILPTEAGQPITALRSDDSEAIILTVVDELRILTGGTLACRNMLVGDDRTTASRPFLLIPQPVEPQVEGFSKPQPETAAQQAIAKIREISALTNEEIAPLAGVSRRSVQAWVAGEPISARKEQRLLALLQAMQTASAATPQMTRQKLLHRTPGNVSAYDLLTEARFDEAVDLVMDRRAERASPAAGQAHDLAAQLDHHESSPDLPPERLARRFAGRLRQ